MSAALENGFYNLYLEYFHNAEANRRWNLQKDIPWHLANRQPDPAVVQVVQTFCAVELFLPDYTSKVTRLVRSSRGRAWFQANWGYEESKHSMALEMWLMASGARTQEQICDYADELLTREYDLPFADETTPLQMIIYTSFQELATSLNYRNLRKLAGNAQDPALDKLLVLLSRDETGHFEFFKNGVLLYMRENRDHVLEELNFVIRNFRMPSLHLIPNGQEHDQLIRKMGIFDDIMFMRDVVKPVLKSLGVSLAELKEARRRLDAA